MVHCVGRWWIQKGRRFYYIWSGKFCVICFNHGADEMIFEIKDELKQKSVEFKEELNKRLLAIGYFLLLLLYYIMARISSCFTQWITCCCGSWKELLKLNQRLLLSLFGLNWSNVSKSLPENLNMFYVSLDLQMTPKPSMVLTPPCWVIHWFIWNVKAVDWSWHHVSFMAVRNLMQMYFVVKIRWIVKKLWFLKWLKNIWQFSFRQHLLPLQVQ